MMNIQVLNKIKQKVINAFPAFLAKWVIKTLSLFLL